MKKHTKVVWTLALILCSPLAATQLAAQQVTYRSVTADALRESPSDSAIQFKILVDAANLGSEETRIAELTFPAGYAGPSHVHNAIEIFYVLSGRFGHAVNGAEGVLEPGDIGIVRPGDSIVHSVIGNDPAVVLTIWLPGGAAAPFHAPQ